jgi:hypothetical protein
MEGIPYAFTVIIINQTFLGINVVNDPLQELNARKYRRQDFYHVEISLANVGEDLIVELPYIRIAMWGIFEGLLFLDFLENFFPARKCHLGSNTCLHVSKSWGLDKGLLGDCLNDGHWLGREF